MSRFASLSVILSWLAMSAMSGCATCPDGRCGGWSDMPVGESCDCDFCGSDGILPNGYPCDRCGPKFPNPLAGRPFRSLYYNLVRCSNGCGEVYWDEWLNDPPTCDPCVGTAGHRHFSLLRSCWAAICGEDCGPACREGCPDGACLAEEAHGNWLHATEREPLEEAPAPPKAAPRKLQAPAAPEPPAPPADEPQPDQKAQYPRRTIRR